MKNLTSIRIQKLWVGAAAATLLMSSQIASACQNSGNFGGWLSQFSAEATAMGVSPDVVAQTLNGVQLDQSVINKDRSQGVFAQSFLEFSNRMVSQNRLTVGAQKLSKLNSTFAGIERDYGVPGPVIASFWGLETDFGAVTGNSPTIPALATLAYDCRRSELFREQLLNALYLVQGGDLSPSEMRGAWAGELGQMQFLPKEYNEFAVDYDGDGRRNLIKSSPDALASGANLLRSFGWRAGEPWLKEVRVPAQMDWYQARLDNRLMPSDWAAMGVTEPNGAPLGGVNLPAALLLPMGKNGPAFLAYPNFDVYLEWNQSLVYSTTAAYFATRLNGAPRVSAGNGQVATLSIDQTRQLQQKLSSQGWDVGKIDGIIGSRTRQAVRETQRQLGLPADGYPTVELLNAF